MRIAIIGQGKMGSLLKTSALGKGMTVIGNFDISNRDALQAQQADVVIDFSHRDNLDWVCDYVLQHEAALVYGTTGLTDADFEKLQKVSKTCRVFYSANYSLGIAVLTKLVKQITPVLQDDFDIEIIEKHHNQKQDAPSGTALQVLHAIDPSDQYKHVFGRQGMIGSRKKEIGIHAVRGGTLAGEHTVLYLGQDEVLEIRHEAISRQIFVNGALKAAEFVIHQPAGFYTMEHLMGE